MSRRSWRVSVGSYGALCGGRERRGRCLADESLWSEAAGLVLASLTEVSSTFPVGKRGEVGGREGIPLGWRLSRW